LVFGIVFELPVLSVILSRLGLISPAFLRKYRRHAIVLFFVVAAILTPPDPTTQVLLAVPLVLLYEVTIFISYIFARKRKAKEIEENLS
jgi:sec-independent protein translocase protein TatC